VPPAPPTVRFGSTAEYFSSEVVPRLGPEGPAVAATFGTDEELLDLLVHGEVDVAVTSTTPGRRAVASAPLRLKRFVLVAAPTVAPATPPATLAELGSWLVGRPWVAYSAELPLTRRFWQAALGRPFAGDLRLTAPDLRAVVAAVALGQGVSLLPTYVCADALARGRIVELYPVSDEVAPEPWFVCTRVGDVARPHVAAFADALRTP
jgi:DNA-binding transcriptional LysR family regulator